MIKLGSIANSYSGLLGTLLLCTGCTTIKDVRIKDSSLELPTFRVAKTLTENMRLELEHARVKGSDTQSLEDRYELIDLDDIQIRGPATIESKLELSMSKAGLEVDVLARDAVELKVAVGVSEVDVDLAFDVGADLERLNQSNWGAYGKFTVLLPVTRSVALSAHAGINKFFDNGSGHLSDVGVRVVWRPNAHVGLFGGWFYWDYLNEEMKSDISAEVRGLSYGIEFLF